MSEAYLCEGLRTPIGRFAGALASVRPDDMLAHAIRATLALAPDHVPATVLKAEILQSRLLLSNEEDETAAFEQVRALVADLADLASGRNSTRCSEIASLANCDNLASANENTNMGNVVDLRIEGLLDSSLLAQKYHRL